MIPSVYSVSDALTLRVCRTEKFKAGMLSISAILPIERDKVPLTSLLLSVLKRGTEKYPTMEAINRRLDYLFGTDIALRNFYRGDCQVIGVSIDFVEESYLPEGKGLLADALEIVAQMLFHPLTDEAGLLLPRYVESEKQLQCDAIRSLKNNPRAYANERFRTFFYENELCGASLYGTEEEIMSVTPEQLTAHWRSLVSNLALDCFYVGNQSSERLCRILSDTLGEELAEGAKRASMPIPTKVIPRAQQVRRVDETLEVGQGHLLLGFRTEKSIRDPENYANVVLNEMLGASPTSKLFMNVREKLSLCYHCSSSYNARRGTLTVLCALSGINRRRAEDEILHQIEELCQGRFTDTELEAAKQSLMNTYRQAEDSPTALESIYFGRALMAIDDTLEDSRTKIEAVSREDVVSAARRLSLDTVYFLDGVLGEGEDEDEED